MTTTIAAIETSYKGCRFRSRLEARWAVFFDALNIEWQYEPQGYMIGKERTPYLPDFWLPGMDLWVEVKGHPSSDGLKMLSRAALPDGLPKNLAGDAWEALDPALYRPRLLLLGNIPEPGDGFLHRRLDLVNGLPYTTEAFFAGVVKAKMPTWATEQLGEPRLFTEINAGDLSGESLATFVRGRPVRFLRPWIPVTDAYRAARSARFEHGESGTPAGKAMPPPVVAKPVDPYDRIRPLLTKLGIDFGTAMEQVVGRFDLDTAEGRVMALRTTAPMVADVTDANLRDEWSTKLASHLGMEETTVHRFVIQAGLSRKPPRLAR